MQEKIFKIQVGKKEVKLCLFTDDMILYIEYPRISTKNLLQLTNKLSKDKGSKSNIQKSFATLAVNNKNI